MPSPFRTTPQLGPNLWQVLKPSTGGVWYDDDGSTVSPKLGTVETGDDGHTYVLVQASGTITAAAAPGTAIVVTEPAFTAAAGAGAFTAPPSTVYSVNIVSGDVFWARRTLI